MRVIHTDLDGLVRIDQLEQDVENARAKLRELAEAAEWRDECRKAKDYCFSRRGDYKYGRSRWERWDRSFLIAKNYLDHAEADYHAALNAAKER